MVNDPAEVTREWLTTTLRANGHLPAGEVTQVQIVERLAARSAIFPLKISYSDDVPASVPRRLMLKITSDGDEQNPEFIFYTTMTQPDFPIIRCYDASKTHFLLEDLVDTHLAHPPSQLPPPQHYMEMIVDALADFHAYWWDHAEIANLYHAEWSASYNAALYKRFADFLGDRLSDERRALFQHVLAGLEPLLKSRFAAGSHLTVIHGDPHIGNFLYPRDPSTDHLRILDWKSWHVNLGADDMAHMMVVFWFPERRIRLESTLLRRYHQRLLARGVRGYEWAQCIADYRLAAMRFLFYPIEQWERGMPADIWWNHLERIIAAYHDLRCYELLDSTPSF